MKTKEELNALKKEVETMSRKRRELTEEELEQVAGGNTYSGHQAPHSLGLYNTDGFPMNDGVSKNMNF